MEQHHTPEQVKMAFAYAPYVLDRLYSVLVEFPHFDLYQDGSGTLWLGDDVNDVQYDLAVELVYSKRYVFDERNGHGIRFCCGLVIGATKMAEGNK